MKFLTLVEIEFKKMFPILAVLFGGGTVLISGLLYKYITEFKTELLMNNAGVPMEELVNLNGPVTLAQILDQNMQLYLLILLIAILTIFSGFYLWYKEWFGYSKRIYLLLTLKGQRFTIYLSKLMVIIMSVFIYYGFVLINLGVGALLMNILLPEGLAAEGLVTGSLLQSYYMDFILPLTPADFIYELLFVVMMFSILSVFVLLDRSKRIWGLVGGISYGLMTVILFFYTQSLFLYSDERLFIKYGFVLIVTLLSTILSYFLLKRKVSI